MRATGSARVSERRRVTAAEVPCEFMLNALRLRAGFTVDEFESHTGLALTAMQQTLDAALERGLLEYQSEGQGGRWLPTELGRRFLNDLQAMFLPVSDPSDSERPDAATIARS